MKTNHKIFKAEKRHRIIKVTDKNKDVWYYLQLKKRKTGEWADYCQMSYNKKEALEELEQAKIISNKVDVLEGMKPVYKI